MGRCVSSIPRVERADGKEVFDLLLDTSLGDALVPGIVEDCQEAMTDALLAIGFAVFDHAGQVLGDNDPTDAGRWAQWLIRDGSAA